MCRTSEPLSGPCMQRVCTPWQRNGVEIEALMLMLLLHQKSSTTKAPTPRVSGLLHRDPHAKAVDPGTVADTYAVCRANADAPRHQSPMSFAAAVHAIATRLCLC